MTRENILNILTEDDYLCRLHSQTFSAINVFIGSLLFGYGSGEALTKLFTEAALHFRFHPL